MDCSKVKSVAWIQTHLRPWGIHYFRTHGSELLNVAFETNRHDFLRWMAHEFVLTAADMYVDHHLMRACSGNYLKLAQWLVDTFVPPTDIGNVWCALHEACRNGHLRVARWLVSEFAIDGNLVRHRNGQIMYQACFYGRLRVVKWLVRTFRFTRAEMEKLHALEIVCAAGENDMRRRFPNVYPGSAMYDLCAESSSNHLRLANWLADTFWAQVPECP